MKSLMFLAPGFEETEAVAVIDLLRRAGVNVVLVGVGADAENRVLSARGVEIKIDASIDKLSDEHGADLLILPGGVPGTDNLAKSERLGALLKAQKSGGKWIAAICAAPSVLEKHGLLAGEAATSHPSVTAKLVSASRITMDPVVISGKIVTSRGMGTSIDFGLALAALLVGKNKADEIRQAICYPHE